MSTISVTRIAANFKPTVNYPRLALVHDGRRALLYFTGRRQRGAEEERAVAVFEGCLASRFGYPNDEALPGHPLYRYGLGDYDFFEVSSSPWMEEVRAQNRVSFPKFDMPARKHFIVTAHDESFECLADSVAVHPASSFPVEHLAPRISAVE
ncbi:hypothetical protein K0B96_10305 [Horticoccus luteus]|uniref:Uncharacterized protein n=1 Tax=Horticoccus luteus TaxID=2862869 RepID=A0A8F9TRM2_9BACT|nr:hypothetical protein [Horticoccus luteus]QYM77716.1 hypothetical protein K0B96_10305 [Horticoccus luteus]